MKPARAFASEATCSNLASFSTGVAVERDRGVPRQAVINMIESDPGSGSEAFRQKILVPMINVVYDNSGATPNTIHDEIYGLSLNGKK